MKRSLLLSIPFLTASLAFAQTSAVPNAISYQGRVADANGVLIGDTAPVNRKVTLRIYDSATASAPIYAEEQTVTINKGVFSVLLGQGLQVNSEPRPAIGTVFNGAERFLGVTVDDGGTGDDPEITPRQQIVSTAYAMRAKVAENASSVTQASGESTFNVITANQTNLNGTLVMNGDNQVFFGGGAGGANGALFSNAGGVGILGRGPTPGERKVFISAAGGTYMQDGPLNFGNRLGQHITLWDPTFGIGIQDGTLYNRAGGQFAWYNNGSHINSAGNPGAGGQALAYLNASGFTVQTGNLYVPNGSVWGTYLDRGNNHGVFAQSFGGGHAFGSQDWTTYSRTARHFAWYLGGAHNGGEFNSGNGEVLMGLNTSGLGLAYGALNFGTRTGQHINLWGTQNGIGIQSNTVYTRCTGGFAWYVNGVHADGEADAGNGGNKLAHWNNDRVDFYRRVYIGANPGGMAPLEINGSSGQFLGTVSEFWFPNNGGAGFNGRSGFSANVSIRATNSVVAHNFVATSDRRLKLPEGQSDAAEDLKTLDALEIVNYTMKDGTIDGGRKHKKVIAQQVEKVFPQAVSQTTGVVPDIFRLATVKDGVIAFKDGSEVDLKKGETVRLVSKGSEVLSEVTEVQKKGFRVKDEVKDEEVFVYGRRVDDLRVVEYEALAMLNVSATQELHRTIQEQAAALKKLSDEKSALEQQLAAAKEINNQQDSRLVAIEKALKLTADAPPTPKKPESTKGANRR